MAAIKSDPRSPLKLPFLVEVVRAGMRQQGIGGGGAFELVALGTAWISSPQLRTAVSKIPFLKTTDATYIEAR